MEMIALQPFSPVRAGFSVEGRVSREGDVVRAGYRVRAPRGALLIPPRAEAPARRDGLWQSTCLELFVGISGEAGYIEINLSPSGDWNAYSFVDYRSGMAPLELPIWRAEAALLDGDGGFSAGFECTLPGRFGEAAGLDCSLTAVLAHEDRARSYWAPAHAGERPDFHLRGSFVHSLGRD